LIEPPCVTVLLSERAPHYSQVKSFAEKERSWITHIDFVENMAEFMSGYDIAIGAPGSTSWERACLGIPSIIIPIAENQNIIAQKLLKVNAVKIVTLSNIQSELVPALNEIIIRCDSYRASNFALCDGVGCSRVVKKIERCMNLC
jgi:Spore coat polysaccharide biosynthesis protein, predicted glycosyltransferase